MPNPSSVGNLARRAARSHWVSAGLKTTSAAIMCSGGLHIERQSARGVSQADAGGIDHDVGIGGDLKVSLPLDKRGGDVDFVSQQPGQFFSPAQRAVDHGDLPGTGQSHFDADRPAAPPAPSSTTACPAGSATSRSDWRNLAVGVFADKFMSHALDTIDGSYQRGRFTQSIEDAR